MTRTHFGQHGPDCFGCKARSISWAFTFGQGDFHGDLGTIKERETQALADAHSAGLDPVSLASRWV